MIRRGDLVAVVKKASLPQLKVLGYGRIERITDDNPRHYYVEGFFMPKEARVLHLLVLPAVVLLLAIWRAW